MLRDIILSDRRHFRALQRGSEAGIASKIPTRHLRDLAAAGLLTHEEAGA